MDFVDQFRLRQVEFVVASVNKNAFGVQKRPDRAVAQDGCFLQLLEEVSGHLNENTGSFADLHAANSKGVFWKPLPGNLRIPLI